MKIGDFALLTNIPVKTLRYYDDIGLLNPAHIDNSNYRYYGAKQLVELNKIIELKETGFTLNEIKIIAKEEMNQKELLRMLKGKLILAKKERQYADIKIANIESQIYKITNKEHKRMILDIKQAPYHSTLMGVIKGVADFYKMNLSKEMIYGLTGQAFMINIHDELCPSGPYCFDRSKFYKLLKDMGIEIIDYGFFSGNDSINKRIDIENTVKDHLLSNNPCGMVNLEYQLIYGYDEKGLLTAQPWSDKYPPAHLNYKTWSELGEDVFMNIFTFTKAKPINLTKQIKNGLQYAIDLNENPDIYTSLPYVTGVKAYDVFIKALDNGHGDGQGCRWNATVWGESRNEASKFFLEIANMYPNNFELANELSNDYKIIGQGLLKVSDTKVPIKPRIKLLNEIQDIEGSALNKIHKLIERI